MMDAEEAKKAYAGISGVLRQSGFEWVAAQVEESIELGKAVAKRADASDFIDDQVAGQRRGRKRMQNFVTTEPYSDVECLKLLLEAIKRMVALPDFEMEILKILEVEEAKFVTDHEDDKGFSLRGTQTVDQLKAQTRFREVLHQTLEVSS